MKQSSARLVWALLIILLVASGAFISGRSPAVVPENAPPDQFSAIRAVKHAMAITRKPHPTGSAEHDEVVSYILNEIKVLGLKPQTQTTTAVRPWWHGNAGASLTNLMVRLKGRETGKAILLVSHYDSAPCSFGAADDGAAVAAMLETLRALRAGSHLRNDVIFLFTDAEELGLLGAQAFVDQHPWAAEVGMVLNFEARGTEGPVLMFETSPGNGRLIREFRRGAAHPVASSLSSEVYKRMPNTTDFTVFSGHGFPGLNFAFIHGGTAYHTPQDSLERLDLRSLQHHGEYALGMARQFGEADLAADWAGARNAVYFNILGSLFLSYPGSLVLPLAIFLLIGMVVFLVLGSRQGKLTVGGLLAGIMANLLGGSVMGILLLLMKRLIFVREYNFVLWNRWTSDSLKLLGLALVAFGLTVLIEQLISLKVSANNLVGSGLSLWLVLTLAISFAAPGGSYLFALPLLPGLGAAFLWLAPRPTETVPMGLFAFLTVSAGVAALLWAPALALTGVALGAQAALPVGIFIFVLLACLMAPHLALMNPRRSCWVLPVGASAIGIALIAVVGFRSGYSIENRQMNSIVYALDTETGEASWLSFDREADAWTSQFLGETPVRGMAPAFLGSFPVLRSPAPVIPLRGAEVELLKEETVPEARILHLRIRWPFKVHHALIFLRSPETIRKVSIDGREAGITKAGATFAYSAPSPEGIRLIVELARKQSLDVEAVAQRFSLPEIPGFSYKRRPAYMMARCMMGRISDSTLIRSVTTLAPDSTSASSRPGQ